MNMKLWRMPILLGILSMVGLISALMEDGIWDALSWLTLGIPVVLMGWYWWRPQSSKAAAR